MGQSAKASPEARAPKLEQPPPHTSAKKESHPAWTDPDPVDDWGRGWGSCPGLISSHLCNPVIVPVPITVSIPVLVTVPVALSPFMSVPVPLSVSVPVSIVVLVPVFPPALLRALVRSGLPGPLASPFGVDLGTCLIDKIKSYAPRLYPIPVQTLAFHLTVVNSLQKKELMAFKPVL
ncbi:hypothetical protein P4O66_001487 [Electrophorus voltai]|uniref:Uncharacterized protein n=1 Tax=Electrophorus voltai TaxID=2609070 RepID=A0AAD8Z644_9TELE|nr:hypothetical protein P4O66_001487 [Electrophorus voltai]